MDTGNSTLTQIPNQITIDKLFAQDELIFDGKTYDKIPDKFILAIHSGIHEAEYITCKAFCDLYDPTYEGCSVFARNNTLRTIPCAISREGFTWKLRE